MITRPKNYAELDVEIMSNLDHEIDYFRLCRLQRDRVIMTYPGGHFHGYIWFKNEKFYAEVHQHGVYKETVITDTIEELKNEVFDKYGRD